MEKEQEEMQSILSRCMMFPVADGYAVYYVKKEAEQDADDFNSMRNRGDNPYTVEEYKNESKNTASNG